MDSTPSSRYRSKFTDRKYFLFYVLFSLVAFFGLSKNIYPNLRSSRLKLREELERITHRDFDPEIRISTRIKKEKESAECQKWITPRNQEPMAICLTGMTRNFELTGYSIVKWLLGIYGYHYGDVFIVSPFDENSHKLTALTGTRLVWVEIFHDFQLNETHYPVKMLKGLEQGHQGLLQQFYMEERCKEVIQEYEKKQNFVYKWIVRSRLDSYWVWPPPVIESMDRTGLTIPTERCDFGGYNDRLSVGDRRSSWAALSRLSNLWNVRLTERITAEEVYKIVLRRFHVHVNRGAFAFCLPSHHFSWRMYPMTTTEPLGGYYCRPCIPENDSDVGSGPKCGLENHWKPGWEERFDATAPPDEGEVRRKIMHRNLKQCIGDLEEMRHEFMSSSKCVSDNPLNYHGHWDSPSPLSLCVRGRLGKRMRLGAPIRHRKVWGTYTFILDASSMIYSLTLGNDTQWDDHLISKVKGIAIHDLSNRISPNPSDKNSVQIWRANNLDFLFWEWEPLGVSRIDVLKLDIGGLAEKVIEKWLSLQSPDPACQLLINFGYMVDEKEKWKRIVRDLRSLDFHYDMCFNTDEETYGRCTFFSSKYCDLS